MNITKLSNTLKAAVLSLALLFVFGQSGTAKAITAADCNPWPEDTAKILDCIDYYAQNPTAQTYEPGTDPANPLKLSLTGIAGIAGAYSPTSQKTLIASGEVVTDSYRPIRGVVLDSNLAITKAVFDISKGPGGTPYVVYDPDKDRFLVAWEDWRNGSRTRQAYAHFVSSDGELIGNDFRVSSRNGFLTDVDYDPNSKNFVFMIGSPDVTNVLQILSADGVPGAEISIPHGTAVYQGQGHLAINTSLNQYWIGLVACRAADTASEDCRETFYKYDIATAKQVGEAMEMSQPQIGHNAFGGANIAYSPVDGAAVFEWLQRIPVGGEYGRTIYDDGRISNQFDILTPSTYIYSAGLGGGHIQYNPYTNSFFDDSEDDSGGTILVEFNSAGTIIQTRQSIAPPGTAYNAFSRIIGFFIHTAKAAVGTFNPATVMVPSGALVLGSQNYSSLVLNSTTSPLQGTLPGPTAPPAAPVPAPKIDLSLLGSAINKWYIWALAIGALLALLMIVVGGIITLTSAGNAERASRGRSYILSSIIGLTLLFGAYILLRTINPDLVNFNTATVQTTTQPK